MEKNSAACLITVISENIASYMFHTPNIRYISLQAKALILCSQIASQKQ
jgi:diphthamide synthase (EF-2-diphthine--ammonia ligase)